VVARARARADNAQVFNAALAKPFSRGALRDVLLAECLPRTARSRPDSGGAAPAR
jgi:hypothetical protein